MKVKNQFIQTAKCLFISTLLVINVNVSANDIRVNNISLTGQNVSSGVNHPSNSIKIQFDLNWKNSWRTTDAPNNWDAAWVFVKYRVGNGEWHHAYLNDSGHFAPSGSQIDLGLKNPTIPFDASTNPAIGVYIRRSDIGSGFLNLFAVQLQWNYRANQNMLVNDNDNIDIRVFGVEMVYVPQGAFAVGDNGIANSRFILTTINTGDATVVPSGIGALGGEAGGCPRQHYQGGQVGNISPLPINASWPNGFNAFYCMKYEISQQQYVGFLNTLTRKQQNTRTATDLSEGITSVTNRYVMSNSATVQFRNGIKCNAAIDATEPIRFYCDLADIDTEEYDSDGRWVACNWVSFADHAAYLDWSGMRPMTELEFEKACRGPVLPILDEYAWGNNTMLYLENIDNAGAINENSVTIGANIAAGNNVQGPLRVGVFATGNSTREQSGATYYGIMDMSGNLNEFAHYIGYAGTANLLSESMGNGTLSINGNANQSNWYGLDNNGEVTTVTLGGARGGAWHISTPVNQGQLYLSSRYSAINGSRSRLTGGRGVRLAP